MEKYSRKRLRSIQIIIQDKTGVVITTKRKLTGHNTRKMALLAGCLLCFVMLGSFAFASSSLLQNRMESLSDKERKIYVTDVENSIADADTFSRDLTDIEKKRIDELVLLYKNEGIFPEGTLLVVENMNEIDEDVLTFVSRESLFVLPDRALIDEEMLELIDFYYKRDYSIMQSSSRAAVLDDESINIVQDIDSEIPIQEVE